MFDATPKPEVNSSLIFGGANEFGKSHENMAQFLFAPGSGSVIQQDDKNSAFSFTTPVRLPSKTNFIGNSNKK